MNITKFFYDNYKIGEYPYYDRILKKYLSMEEYKTYPNTFIDDDEIISKWKNCLYPSNYNDDTESIFYFCSISYYLLKQGYIVKQIPDLLIKIKSSSELSDGLLKDATRNAYGTKPNGAVAWADRRKYIDELEFTKDTNYILHSDEIEELFKMVSTRNAAFNEMSIDEKLEQIRNVFSYLGKSNNKKYISIDFEKISNGLITNQEVIDYQNKIQCFRHGEPNMLEQRKVYSMDQKEFFVDFGLTIINATERYLKS